MLGKLIGRVYDLIQTTDGKRVAGEYVTDVLEYVPGIRQFQLVQEDWSHFVFRIVKEPDIYQEQSESKIRSKFQEVLGNRVSISFDYVPSISLPDTFFESMRTRRSRDSMTQVVQSQFTDLAPILLI